MHTVKLQINSLILLSRQRLTLQDLPQASVKREKTGISCRHSNQLKSLSPAGRQVERKKQMPQDGDH